MLARLKALLAAEGDAARHPSEQLSTALLLLELARSDFEFGAVERARVAELLASRYGLDAAGTEALMHEAQAQAGQAVSLHDYVQALNGRLDAEGKRALFRMLWQVAWADGRLDPHEEHLLRRLADLLYLPMPDYIRIKLESSGEAPA